MSRKCISKKANSKGTIFALVTGPDGFEVWKLAENYAAHCKGGVARSWRYIQKGLTEATARAMFDKRTAA